jgi:hypothetical protein
VPWWVWLALVAFVAVTVGATVACVVWGLRIYRSVRSVGPTTVRALDELAIAAARIEARSAALPERAAELESSLERLRQSQARLQVLTAEIGYLRRLTSFVPRK